MAGRYRRTKAEMQALKEAIYRVAEENRPVTVRQVFYRLVAAGAIPKEESQYGAVSRELTKMRRAHELPFSWIADNTRWIRRPDTYSSMQDALKATARTYRRRLWDDADCRVEVWCEKDALAGVLVDITDQYDVPLMVHRGYSSHSYLYSIAEEMVEADLPTYIYIFGDYDPSGRDIIRYCTETVREYAPDAELHFSIVAVTPDQIVELNLPTRPPKEKDTRRKGFKGEAVDLAQVR